MQDAFERHLKAIIEEIQAFGDVKKSEDDKLMHYLNDIQKHIKAQSGCGKDMQMKLKDAEATISQQKTTLEEVRHEKELLFANLEHQLSEVNLQLKARQTKIAVLEEEVASLKYEQQRILSNNNESSDDSVRLILDHRV